MARNIRTLKQTTYTVNAIVVENGTPKQIEFDSQTDSERLIIKTLKEQLNLKSAQVCIVSVEPQVKQLQIIDLQSAIDAGFIRVIEDEDGE